MARVTHSGGGKWQRADMFDRTLALAALLLMALVVIALVRGASQWRTIDGAIWVHVVAVSLALVIAPIQLLRRRGDSLHRLLGGIWAILLLVTAGGSFAIRVLTPDSLSLIHLLSVLTLVSVPVMVWAARTGRIETHRGFARGLIAGAILVAGFFTLLPDRILGGWLFG